MNAEQHVQREVNHLAGIEPISVAWYYFYFSPRLCWRGDRC